MCSIHLIESPEEVFRRPINIVAAGVVREILAQRRSPEFLPKQVDFIQEQDDACSHEPAGVDNRIKQNQTLHHSVLNAGESARCTDVEIDNIYT